MTDAATLELIDLSTITTEAVPCSWPDCPHEAEWRLLCDACRNDAAVRACEQHRQEIPQLQALVAYLFLLNGGEFACKFCNANLSFPGAIVAVPL